MSNSTSIAPPVVNQQTQTDPKQIILLDLEQMCLELNEIYCQPRHKAVMYDHLIKLISYAQSSNLPDAEIVDTIQGFCTNRNEP